LMGSVFDLTSAEKQNTTLFTVNITALPVSVKPLIYRIIG